VLSARGVGARFDIELRDDRYDGWQVGLVPDDLVQLVQEHTTQGALIQGDVDDTVDLVQGRRGPKICGVPLVAAGRLGFVAAFGSAKGMGSAMRIALRLIELLAEALEFFFQFGDPAIALLTAGTGRTSKSHEVFPKIA
jgi:hypothetical protein